MGRYKNKKKNGEDNRTEMPIKKHKYCSKECAKKANNDISSRRKSHLWYNDIEFRKQKVLKNKGGLGTITLAKNKDNDWKKEIIRIRALKKRAGLRRA